MGRDVYGHERTHTADDCPKRGKLVFPQDGDHLGGHGSTDRGFYVCKLCGENLKRFPYPEEALQHPPVES